MGHYINPSDMSKEDFLKLHGKQLTYQELSNIQTGFDFTTNQLPVCLVSNGMFTAAGICYDQNEILAFNSPTDQRYKSWYLVSREALSPYYKE